jgi:hypothetical protein
MPKSWRMFLEGRGGQETPTSCYCPTRLVQCRADRLLGDTSLGEQALERGDSMRRKIRPFWYLSSAKLDALVAGDFPWAERSSAKLNLGVEGVGVEAALAAGQPREAHHDTLRRLKRVEKELRKERSVVDVERLSDGPATFFRYQGPSVGLVQEAFPHGLGFFLAALVGNTAVLLLGSGGHAAGVDIQYRPVISPSAAPIESMVVLAERDRGSTASTLASNDLSYAWAMMIKRGLGTSPPSSWPLTTGVALYAGQSQPDQGEIAHSGYGGTVESLVVGPPLYVEQTNPSRK